MTQNMVEHHAAVVVNAPVHQVYSLFSHFNDFPKFMSFIKEVTYYDDSRSHWAAEVAGHHEWDAVNEDWIPEQQIGWRSTNGLDNYGRVLFQPVAAGQTHIDVYVNYDPPAGVLGDIGEHLGIGRHFDEVLQNDLNNFAQMVDQSPTNAEDPNWSQYLFHPDSAAARGITTPRQNATMGGEFASPEATQQYVTTDQQYPEAETDPANYTANAQQDYTTAPDQSSAIDQNPSVATTPAYSSDQQYSAAETDPATYVANAQQDYPNTSDQSSAIDQNPNVDTSAAYSPAQQVGENDADYGTTANYGSNSDVSKNSENFGAPVEDTRGPDAEQSYAKSGMGTPPTDQGYNADDPQNSVNFGAGVTPTDQGYNDDASQNSANARDWENDDTLPRGLNLTPEQRAQMSAQSQINAQSDAEPVLAAPVRDDYAQDYTTRSNTSLTSDPEMVTQNAPTDRPVLDQDIINEPDNVVPPLEQQRRNLEKLNNPEK